MTEKKTKAEGKKETTLKQKLDALTFSNRQAGDISKMQSGQSAVKSNVGRRKKSGMTSSQSSLQSLKNTLGLQFSK
jgi:hypothetical protein